MLMCDLFAVVNLLFELERNKTIMTVSVEKLNKKILRKLYKTTSKKIFSTKITTKIPHELVIVDVSFLSASLSPTPHIYMHL